MKEETDMVLAEALRLVQDGWCCWNLAEDAGGEYVDPESDDAVAWCASGAVVAAIERLGFDDPRGKLQRRALYRVAHTAGCADDDWQKGIERAVMNWNDSQDSAEDVILAFKRSLQS
jgi:hypothetical protein